MNSARLPFLAKVHNLALWKFAVLFIAGSLAIYLPSLHGEFIWDDVDIYIVKNPMLGDSAGIYKFWFSNEPYDYYPLTYTTFWFEWALVGEDPFLYHFNNVILHALTGLGVFVLLSQLKVPWPLFLALVFLVHPIQVESVAWVCQRKTVLSALLGVCCCIAYMRDVHHPSRRMRGISVALFALSSIPAVLAFVCFCNSLQIVGAEHNICRWLCQLSLFLATLVSLWSWLLWQQGPMDYLNWVAMIEGQYLRIRTWMKPELLAILCAGCLVSCFGLAQFKSEQRLKIWTAVLSTLLIAQLLERAENSNFNLPMFYVSTLVCSLVVFCLWRLHRWKPGLTWVASTLVSDCFALRS